MVTFAVYKRWSDGEEENVGKKMKEVNVILCAIEPYANNLVIATRPHGDCTIYGIRLCINYGCINIYHYDVSLICKIFMSRILIY